MQPNRGTSMLASLPVQIDSCTGLCSSTLSGSNTDSFVVFEGLELEFSVCISEIYL